MRNLFKCLAAALAFAGPVLAAGAQEDVKAIIEKAIKAHGGKEKLAKLSAVESKSTGTIELFGGINFAQASTSNLPKQFKESLAVDINGSRKTTLTVFDDGKAWTNVNGETIDLDDKTLEEMKHASYLMQLGSLRFVDDKDYKVTSLGESKVEGKPAVGVKVAHQGNRDVKLYFAKDTGLLSKVECQTYDPRTMRDTSEERLILDYQDLEGMKIAKKVLVRRDGKKYLEAEVTEFKILDKVDPTEFARP